MPAPEESGIQQPLLRNGDEVGETTVQVDNIVTQGRGEFRETADGEQVPPER